MEINIVHDRYSGGLIVEVKGYRVPSERYPEGKETLKKIPVEITHCTPNLHTPLLVKETTGYVPRAVLDAAMEEMLRGHPQVKSHELLWWQTYYKTRRGYQEKRALEEASGVSEGSSDGGSTDRVREADTDVPHV